MGENLREVIARMKAQNQVQIKPVEEKAKVELPIEEEQFDELEDEEEPKEQVKASVKPQETVSEPSKEMSQEQQILMEIEMLQNNGRFRAELLHQMQEINRALVVIAGVLVDLSGNGKTK